MNFSFQSIKDYLVDKYSELTGFKKEIILVGVFSSIFDAVAAFMEKVVYYFEFYVVEVVWGTARFFGSIVAMARFLNYIPKRAVGAKGKIKVVPFAQYLNQQTLTPFPQVYQQASVFIPKWTTLSNQNGDITVYTLESYYYYAGTKTIVKKIHQSASSFIGLSGGRVAVTIDPPGQPHGIETGKIVSIRNTINYNGDYIAQIGTGDPTIDPSYIDKVIIRAPFFPEDTTFNSSASIASGHLLLEVKEGEPKEFLYQSQGVLNEEITLFSSRIDQDSIEVFISDPNGEPITPVLITKEPYFINNPSTYACEVINSFKYDRVIVRFGDGIRTRRLVPGEFILIRYAETKGEAGNILETNIIRKFTVPPIDANGQPVNFAITNEFPLTGGSDIEDIDTIRRNAPALFNSGYRASSNSDWQAILLDNSSISKCLVWTDYDLNKLTITPNQNIVYIAAINNLGFPLTSLEKALINDTYLFEKKSLTDVILWEDPQVIFLKFRINAKIKPVPFTQVENEVFQVLFNRYSILKTNFATPIYESNYVGDIDELENIIYHTTDIYHIEKSNYFSDIQPNTSAKVIAVSVLSGENLDPNQQILLTPGSVEVWLKRKINNSWNPVKKIAITDPNNNTQLIAAPGSNYYINPQTTLIDYNGNSINFSLLDFLQNHKVTRIDVLNGGTGYTAAAIELITGGSGANITVNVSDIIEEITVLNSGSDYDIMPTVTLTPATMYGVAPVFEAKGKVNGFEIVDGGNNYIAMPTPLVSGGGGTGATITVSGGIGSVTVTSGGSGYTSPPTVLITGGGGIGAVLQANLVGTSVDSITVLSEGSGFTTAPTLTLVGGGGTGATATAYLTVNGVTITNPGTDYDSAPTVTFSGGGGSGADVTLTLGIDKVNVLNRGEALQYAPAITNFSFSPTLGSGAQLIGTLRKGAVSSVNILSGGSGYTIPPLIEMPELDTGSGATFDCTLLSESIDSVNIVNTGSNYPYGIHTLSISGGGSGSGAVATAVVSGGSITEIIVIESGNNYSTAPTVQIIGDGTGALAKAVLGAVPKGEPDEGEPLTSFGVLNPIDINPNGYILSIVYRTQDGNPIPLSRNSVRFPRFFQISNIDQEDLEYNLFYE